jgi:23S rRNA pseudouridine2605 synthase
VTTHADPEGRPTIFQALPKELPRLISIGRLDLGTEGLLLLTNDGGLARALELPATGWLRRYRVRAHGSVTQDALDALRDGIRVDGVRYGAIEATLDRVQGANVWLTFAIREGKNREVRNVLGALGLAVNRLIRVSFGPFQLAELPEGGIEEVKTRTLRDQLGERLARLAGADFSATLSLPVPLTVTSPPSPRAGRRWSKRPDAAAASVNDAEKPQPDSRARPSQPGAIRAEKPERTARGKRAGAANAPRHPDDKGHRGAGKKRSSAPQRQEKQRPDKPHAKKPGQRRPTQRKHLARDRGRR